MLKVFGVSMPRVEYRKERTGKIASRSGMKVRNFRSSSNVVNNFDGAEAEGLRVAPLALANFFRSHLKDVVIITIDFRDSALASIGSLHFRLQALSLELEVENPVFRGILTPYGITRLDHMERGSIEWDDFHDTLFADSS
jgi:hypothetical protein